MVNKQQGLTLIELMVSLTLVGILLMSCLSLGRSIHQENQLQGMEDEITMAVRYARNMALLHQTTLVLSPLPNTTDWSEGMMLFVDNKSHKYHSDKILHQWQWQHKGIHVFWDGFQSNHYLIFSSELKQAATSGHFDIFNDEIMHSKLVINRFGRISKR